MAARATARADLAALGAHRRGGRGDRHGAAARRGLVPDRAHAAGRHARTFRAGRYAPRPDIAAALGLHLIAGTDLDAGERGPRRRRRDAGPADRDGRRAALRDGRRRRRTKPSTAAPSGAAAWRASCGTSRSAAAGCPAATSIVIVDAEPVTEHEIVYVMRAPGRRRAAVIAAARAALAGSAGRRRGDRGQAGSTATRRASR